MIQFYETLMVKEIVWFQIIYGIGKYNKIPINPSLYKKN